MGFYFVVFAILTVFAFVEVVGLKRRDRVIIYWFWIFAFFVLSFIRWEKGTDWGNYYDFFTTVQWDPNYTEGYEWGFEFLNNIVGRFTDNYSVMLFFSALILYYFQSLAIKRMSPYPLVSVFVLWALYWGNIFFVRQWIGIAILLYSIKYIERRCFSKFLLLVILATGFHRVCWLFLVAWWIWDIRWSVRTQLLILFGCIGLSSVFAYVLQLLGPVLGSVVEAKFALYLSEDYNQGQAESMNMTFILIRGFVNKVMILLFAMWMKKRIVKDYPQFYHYINLFWFGSILYFMALPISVAFARITYPFDFVQVIIFPFLLKGVKDKILRMAMFFVFSCYLMMRFWLLLHGPYMEEFIPFKTIFQN